MSEFSDSVARDKRDVDQDGQQRYYSENYLHLLVIFFWTMAYGKVREKGVKNRMASVLTPPRALGTFTTGAYPRLNWLKRMDDDDGWLQAPPG